MRSSPNKTSQAHHADSPGTHSPGFSAGKEDGAKQADWPRSLTRTLNGGRWVYPIFAGVPMRAWVRRSGPFFLVKRGCVGDADDQAIAGEEPGHCLSPRLGAGRVQQLKARALKLATCRCNSVGVRHLELD